MRLAGQRSSPLEIKCAFWRPTSSCKTVSMIFAVFDLENPAFAQEPVAVLVAAGSGARYQQTRWSASQTLLGGNAMAKRPAR
jgi:hypothetical protein